MITKQVVLKATEWLANSRTSMCTVTMVAWLTYGAATAGRNHPRDPEDFNRCLLLLQAVPELRDHLHRMKKLSPAWKRLVARWADIERVFLEEVGLGWHKGKHLPADLTYALMQDVLHTRKTEQ